MPVDKDTLMFFESIKGNNCKVFIVNLAVAVYIAGDNGFADRLSKI